MVGGKTLQVELDHDELCLGFDVILGRELLQGQKIYASPADRRAFSEMVKFILRAPNTRLVSRHTTDWQVFYVIAVDPHAS